MAPTSGYPLPHRTPVFLTRVGREHRYVVVAVLDEGPFEDRAEAEKACESWTMKVGRWISRSSAARRLGISGPALDVLRASGKIKDFHVGTRLAIDLDSVIDEQNRRANSSDYRLNPLPVVNDGVEEG
jgi:hypothetical protein